MCQYNHIRSFFCIFYCVKRRCLSCISVSSFNKHDTRAIVLSVLNYVLQLDFSTGPVESHWFFFLHHLFCVKENVCAYLVFSNIITEPAASNLRLLFPYLLEYNARIVWFFTSAFHLVYYFFSITITARRARNHRWSFRSFILTSCGGLYILFCILILHPPKGLCHNSCLLYIKSQRSTYTLITIKHKGIKRAITKLQSIKKLDDWHFRMNSSVCIDWPSILTYHFTELACHSIV